MQAYYDVVDVVLWHGSSAVRGSRTNQIKKMNGALGAGKGYVVPQNTVLVFHACRYDTSSPSSPLFHQLCSCLDPWMESQISKIAPAGRIPYERNTHKIIELI